MSRAEAIARHREKVLEVRAEAEARDRAMQARASAQLRRAVDEAARLDPDGPDAPTRP